MDAPRPLPTTTRPVLVTVAVAVWLVESAVRIVSAVARGVVEAQDDGWSAIVPVVIAVVIWLALAWGATRLAKGSSRARFWMAVLGALAFIGSVLPPYGVASAGGVLLGIAAVLPYLPPSRPFFPRTARGAARAPEPRIVGWDPETGEPIRERG